MDINKLNENWSDICARIMGYPGVDSTQIVAFFSRLQPQAMSEGFLMLTADNEFIRNWIERHYLDHIKQALMDLYHVPFTVLIEVDPNSSSVVVKPDGTLSEKKEEPKPVDSLPPQNVEDPPSTAVPYDAYRDNNESLRQVIKDELGEQKKPFEKETTYHDSIEGPSSILTFENFVIGDSNRMAYSMSVDVAENPGQTVLNPLFIYGKSGLGKTHLMRAIQNYIFETQPAVNAIYVDSADLLNDFTEASVAHDKEKSSFKNFKDRYLEADVLLIDDIQSLQGKRQTLENVFQIFNKLIEWGKQVVLSADRAPKNIDIDDRYRSRFSQGCVVDIQPPEVETKLGIVKSFINQYKRNENMANFTIPEDVQLYIAENSGSNIRELKSAITKVIYHMEFFNQPDLSVSEVRTLLKNHFSTGLTRSLTVEDIQKEVESFFKVKHNELIGPVRSRNIVYPRQIAIYLCRQMTDLPFNTIAKKFNRDHSTAMHSVNAIEKLVRDSREVQEEIETLKHLIREQ